VEKSNNGLYQINIKGKDVRVAFLPSKHRSCPRSTIDKNEIELDMFSSERVNMA